MKTLNFFRLLAPGACILGGLLLAFAAQAVTLYKWVDAEGNVSYQDSPPPAGQKYEERSFSDEGARTGGRNTEIARSEAIRENPVTLYRAEACESCDLVEGILKSNNAPFTATWVDTDAEAQTKLQALIGSIRVPTLTIGSNVINGTNRAAIEDALRDNGYPAPEAQAQPQAEPGIQ